MELDPADSGNQNWPTVAVGPSGTLYATVSSSGSSVLVQSTDSGASWSVSVALDTPEGAIASPTVHAGDASVGVVGVTAAGSVWVDILE